MNRKKGFTLVELLAVIVILAVIAIIAVPIILNVIESAKKGAIKDSAHGILESANVYVASNLKEGVKTNLKFTCEKNKCTTSDNKTINFKGKVEHGTLIIDSKGNALVCVDDGDYYALKNVDEKDVTTGDGTCGAYEEANGTFVVHNATSETIKELEETKKELEVTVDVYKSVVNEGVKLTITSSEIVWDLDYTGSYQELTAPLTGTYKLETWGAQGGSYNATWIGGYGGYSTGEVQLTKGDKIYIYIGGAGTNKSGTNSGGYNGGGSTASGNYIKCSGGGATHIAKENGLLSSLSSKTESILIVSGGGGGSANYRSQSGRGGDAGGYTGSTSTCQNSGSYVASGGTQAKGGTYSTSSNAGTFGQGFSQMDTSNYGAAGGGGYYGGGGGYCCGAGGGGGSGFINNNSLTNKAMYCFNCSESNQEATLTVSTTGTNELADKTNCPDGYSATAISKCAKAGNGYARITYTRES